MSEDEGLDKEARQAEFEEEADSVESWEKARKSLSAGGKVLFRQQDIKPNTRNGLAVRFIRGPFGTWAQAWVHMIKVGKDWKGCKRIVCLGDVEKMNNSAKPQLDPDNCPICECSKAKVLLPYVQSRISRATEGSRTTRQHSGS
jgi:hypothetical protein